MNDIAAFQALVWDYYRQSRRSFPWRDTRDPYEILVSEFMLQQTQTDRVVPKYLAFLDRFPDLRVLAAAAPADVLALWMGLGYYRRALWLQAAAAAIVRDHGGAVPADAEYLDGLPGIGPYTAAAVVTFAFDLPKAFVETNIRSAVIHAFFQARSGVRDAEVLAVVEAAVDNERPRDWYYALMDYGAYVKKAFGNPARRGRTYRKQAPFAGSSRQLRGLLLRELVTAPGTRRAVDLAAASGRPLGSVYEALAGLVADGLVAEVDGRYGSCRGLPRES